MNETIKKTDQQLHDIASAVGSEQRERNLIDFALQIHQRKYSGFSEERVKDMLKHIESAGLISGSDREKIVEKLFKD